MRSTGISEEDRNRMKEKKKEKKVMGNTGIGDKRTRTGQVRSGQVWLGQVRLG